MSSTIKMGTLNRTYKDGRAKLITFCVTEECNLRCKYCYMTEKNSFSRMSIETAKKAVDFFLSEPPVEQAVIWEFIGGEPTLEIELIDQIVDYIKVKTYTMNHPWFSNYMISMSTNGVLYRTPLVQNFIKKNINHLAIGMTIDGIKEKHDLQRVRMDGSGSYDEVIKSFYLWHEQFPHETTKVTFASEDLKYLKDSIIHLWNLGLNVVPANVVFEDVWQDGDDVIYEQQLIELADYIIENKLWETHSVRFFDPTVGHPLNGKSKQEKHCGSGTMTAVDCHGNLYPCIRFLDFCVNKNPPLIVGNIDSGYDQKKLYLFKHLNIGILNDAECATCQVASGCFSCSGNNYTYSETGTIFIRTKFQCKMHKAQSRANDYFWSKLLDYIDGTTPYEENRKRAFDHSGWAIDGAKYLYFITADNIIPHCMYKSHPESSTQMTKSILEKGLSYARVHNMIPVFLGDVSKIIGINDERKVHVEMLDCASIKPNKNAVKEIIPITNNGALTGTFKSCILLVSKQNVDNFHMSVKKALNYCQRVNLVKIDMLEWGTEEKQQYIFGISNIKAWLNENHYSFERINVFSEGNSRCLAGQLEFSLSPDGRFYVCPAFYFDNPQNSIGDLEEGIINKDASLFSKNKTPGCDHCDHTQCKRCWYINYKSTTAVNIPSAEQCWISGQESELIQERGEIVFERVNKQ